MTIAQTVNTWPTKYVEGFTPEELEAIIAKYPNINRTKLKEALICASCIMKDNQTIIYHCDIVTALRSGLQK